MHGILFNVAEHAHQNRTAGVYRIAHYLRENDADIEVVDWANHWTLPQLQELFRSRYNANLKFIGFSHMFSIWADVLENFCEWVKKQYPEIKIISGSSVPPSFQSKYIDFYIRGFGEHAILALTRYIAGNGTRPKFSLELANGRPMIEANTSYTAYPMQSLMIKYEDRDFLLPYEWLGIETARGCKFECDFCSFPVLGVKGDYTRDAKDFELHLREVYDRFGISNYVVADETFNDRTEKIVKFADVVDTLPFLPSFTGFIRGDLFHSRPQDIEALARMNFIGQFYGIESFNRASAKSVGKGLDPEKVKGAILNCKQYFAKVGRPYRGTVSLIIGLPHETRESLQNTMQWLIDNWQQQNFSAYTLSIPIGRNNKESLISQDYGKYGYRAMTDAEIQQKIIDSSTSGSLKHANSTHQELIWANDHMDIFSAQKITKEFANIKKYHDFRQGNFMLAFRSKLQDLQSRLKTADWVSHRGNSYDEDIQDYINQKLSLQ